MALFDRKGVPEFLLQRATERADFDEAINILIGFALVSAEVGGADFVMHRLVQLSTIVWLQHLGDLEQQKEAAVDALAECYPSGSFENWATCLLLEPHALSLLEYGFSSGTSRVSRAQVQRNRAWYYVEQGEYRLAEQFAKQSVDDASCFLGDEHPDTLTSMNNLAHTYEVTGCNDKAIQLMKTAARLRGNVLRPDHPHTKSSASTLASWMQF